MRSGGEFKFMEEELTTADPDPDIAGIHVRSVVTESLVRNSSLLLNRRRTKFVRYSGISHENGLKLLVGTVILST